MPKRRFRVGIKSVFRFTPRKIKKGFVKARDKNTAQLKRRFNILFYSALGNIFAARRWEKAAGLVPLQASEIARLQAMSETARRRLIERALKKQKIAGEDTRLVRLFLEQRVKRFLRKHPKSSFAAFFKKKMEVIRTFKSASAHDTGRYEILLRMYKEIFEALLKEMNSGKVKKK
jgi:hypothetical protein